MSGSKPTELAGYLIKRGSVVKNWKQRWFALEKDGLVLAYYKKKGDKKRAGVIDTISVSSIVCSETCGGIWPQVRCACNSQLRLLGSSQRPRLGCMVSLRARVRWVGVLPAMLPNIIGRIHPPTPSSHSDLCAVSTAL